MVPCAEGALFVGKRLPPVDGRPEIASAAAGVFLRPFTGRRGQCNASLAALHTGPGRSTSARRASSRRTHKSSREAPRDYSSRFRRAGRQRKGPRRGAAAEGNSQQLEKTRECATNVISGARGPGGKGRRSVRAPAAGFAA